MGQLQFEHRIDPEGFGGFAELSVYGFVPDGRGAGFRPYQEYLADLRMEHPVITARYFTTAFGDKVGTAPSAFTDSIHEYQWLQYNCVFDRAHRIPGFYS